jgi:hypothetical protein
MTRIFVPQWCGRSARARFLSPALALRAVKRLSALSMHIASLALCCLSISFASTAHAQHALVGYLEISGPFPTSVTSSSLPSPSTFVLPGYGSVQVSWSATVSNAPLPYFYPQDEIPAYNEFAGTAPIYTWGTDTQMIGIFNSTPNAVSYTVTYTFLSGPPDLNRLLLVVAGLGLINGQSTTATVSQSGKLVEFTIPFPSTSLVSSPTSIDGIGKTLSSGYSNVPNEDQRNTGWALFQVTGVSTLPVVSGNPVLTVQFSHQSGDGIGTTLGYVQKGLLKICKVAGPGIAVGTPFSFTAGGNTVGPVPAGPSPGGTCVLGPTFPVGSTITVAETPIPTGDIVSNIVVAPPGQSTIHLGAGSVDVTIGTGVTEVTFTDKRTGFLEICKTGPVTGNFTVGGLGPFVVPAGACSPAIEVAAGSVVITEQPPPGIVITASDTIPAGNQLSFGLVTSTVNVVPGDISTMTIALITNGRAKR